MERCTASNPTSRSVFSTTVGGTHRSTVCLLYTSDAADERSSVDLGGRRIIKKKKQITSRAGCSLARKTKSVAHETQ